jgi:hypothetical protein
VVRQATSRPIVGQPVEARPTPKENQRILLVNRAKDRKVEAKPTRERRDLRKDPRQVAKEAEKVRAKAKEKEKEKEKP